MDHYRAQEIIHSPTMVHVQYRGIPIFLQEVHPEQGMATVFPLDNMNDVQVVDLQGLTEIPMNPGVSQLNRQRAEEIAQSGDLKHVTYNGQRVYIQQVNENSDTARVYLLDEPQNEFDAHLSQLEEKS